MSAALSPEDVELLGLALDTLSHHADAELAEARRHGNNAKQLAMITMGQRIAAVRVKLGAMVSP
jgi:hypothetical protein